jgi:uncharacterized protein
MTQSPRSILGLGAVLLLTGFGCGEADLDVTNASGSAALGQGPISPGLAGSQLLQLLVAGYKPRAVLGYKEAVDELFGTIDVHDGMLRCVYTGYEIRMPDRGDPSSYANSHNINLEHTLPQSEGASGNAKSDMHHMFPARMDANGTRGNFPFASIDDSIAQDWFCGAEEYGTRPTSGAEGCSKFTQTQGQRFEPRDDHKGHVARAMFYMYTMYGSQISDSFFDEQKSVLSRWNELYPPDATEIERTWKIAALQENKPNPFVVDPTLVQRAYFSTASSSH